MVVMQIYYGTKLHDGWRHFHFIYPLIVLVALRGMKVIPEIIRQLEEKKTWLFPRIIFNTALSISFSPVLIFMVKYHLYQYT